MRRQISYAGRNQREKKMTSELTSLTWVVTLNAVMWMPYVVNTIMVRGLMDAVGYPDEPKALVRLGDQNESSALQCGREPRGIRSTCADRKRRRCKQRHYRDGVQRVLLGTCRAPAFLHDGNPMGPDTCLCCWLGMPGRTYPAVALSLRSLRSNFSATATTLSLIQVHPSGLRAARDATRSR